MQQATAMMRRGEFESAISAALERVARYRASQSKVAIPYLMTFMIDGCRRAGQFEQGFELLRQVRAEMDETGEDCCRSSLWRVQGELTLLRSPQATEEAQACFQEALTVARQQQAKWLELQAANALSRLWLKTGKKQQARELLVPVYDWFTEGFEYADLKAAKVLLDELA
jgi:predicted ATPase